MWKVERKCELGFVGQDVFQNEQAAKSGFRKIIAHKLGEGISSFTDRIDGYCKEFYPEGAPEEFGQLKDLLTKLATDPAFPRDLQEVELEDFEDDNVEFYLAPGYRLFCYVNNPAVEGKFISAEINAIQFFEDNWEDDNFFFITDNRDGAQGEHFYVNIDMTVASPEDEEQGTVNSGLPEAETKYSHC